jgi:hypothetical protein
MRGWAVATLALAAALVGPDGAHAFVPLGVDFRISFMGPDGNNNYGAESPSVAYNPVAGEYLVVWEGDDNTPPLVDNEYEIWAQRLSAAGARLGGRIRVSAQGADGDPGSEAHTASVAFNPTDREYLVAWEGEVGATGEFEIWGRRLSAAGDRLGDPDDLQISDMGPPSNASYDAFNPSVVFNPAAGEYLVVWEGDEDTPLADDEFEIFGQRLSAAGAHAGANDFRISEQGADGVAATSATDPSVAYNPVANEYLVAWTGEEGMSDEDEIWAQRLSASGGEVGGSDYRISAMGPDGNATYNALRSSVAANPATGGYLVAWQGDDDTGALRDDEYEIFSQRLTATGAQTGADDLRISETGSDGVGNQAGFPSVTATANEYLVVWRADDDLSLFEIFGQRLPATGVDAVEDDVRISTRGPKLNPFYNASNPSIAYNPSANEYLAAWGANDNTPPLAQNEREILGRRLGDPPPPAGGRAPGGGGGGGTVSALPAFGSRTLVTIALAARRVPASGPLKVRVTNRNDFAVAGRLAGRTTRPVSAVRKRRVKLKARSFNVRAHGRRTVKLRLPRSLRRTLKRTGKLSLRLTARVSDPAGNRRNVNRKVTPRLKPTRRH